MFQGRTQDLTHALMRVFPALLLALCPPHSTAQNTAAISGQVQDASGAAVGDATIGGQGIRLTRRYADSLCYQRTGDTNQVTVAFRR